MKQMKPKFIEFDRETMRPFSLYFNGYQWDAEYCRRDDQIYIEESGHGSSRLEHSTNFWWSVDGEPPDVFDSRSKGYIPAPIENQVELPASCVDEDTGEAADVDDWAMYSRCVCCKVCDDWLPIDDLCNHLVWDDITEDWIVAKQ